MNIIRLVWSNTKDMAGLLYQTGWRQELYLRGWLSRPVLQRNEEVVIDGYGKERVVSSRTVQRYEVEVLPLHDSQLNALQIIRDHDNKQLFNTETGETFNMDNYTFAFEPIGKAYNKGVITFDTKETLNTGHGRNFELGDCPVFE